MSDAAPPADKPRSYKLSAFLGGLCEVIAVLSLACTWLGSLGRYGWAFELLSHFRLQYVITCVVVLLLALCRRRAWLVLAALVSLLWNVRIVQAYQQTAAVVAASSEKPLRVLSFNVLSGNTSRAAAIEHVLQADADIVCLLEVDESWRPNLQPLRVKYPHIVEELSDGDFSIACYTRLPLKSLEVRRFTAWRLPTIVLNLDHLGRPLTFIGMHPMAPLSEQSSRVWREQLSGIAALVANLTGEVILAGDLNATPWCEGMRLLRQTSSLDFHSVAPVWPPTWGLYRPMMIPIDHVLMKGGLSVQQRVLGPALGSDHRSVTVEIQR